MDNYAKELLGSVRLGTGEIGGMVVDYAIVMAIVGILVMGVQETIKEIFRIRMRFNRWHVRRWTQDHADTLRELHLLTTGGVSDSESRQFAFFFLWLDPTDMLYDQPVEKMLAQVQAAANIALEYPKLYPSMFHFLAEQRRYRWDKTSEWGTTNERDADDAKRYFAFAESGDLDRWNELGSERKLEISQVKTRLQNRIVRRLDMFQNQTQLRWAFGNQVWAVYAAGTLLMLILQDSGVGQVRAFVWGIFGGLLAPLAKDIVAGIKSFAHR